MLADMWVYSVVNGAWARVGTQVDLTNRVDRVPTASWPGARARACSVVDSANNLWLLGGVGCDQAGCNAAFGDLWRFTAGAWTLVSGVPARAQPRTATSPGVVDSAACSCDGDRIWVFGGLRPNGNSATNVLWRYDIRTAHWTQFAPTAVSLDAPSVHYGTPGSFSSASWPGPHTVVAGAARVTNDGWFMVFGGLGIASNNVGGLMEPLSDLWAWNIYTHQWAHMPSSITTLAADSPLVAPVAPGARVGARIAVMSNSTVVMSGGADPLGGPGFYTGDLWEFNLITRNWKLLFVSDDRTRDFLFEADRAANLLYIGFGLDRDLFMHRTGRGVRVSRERREDPRDFSRLTAAHATVRRRWARLPRTLGSSGDDDSAAHSQHVPTAAVPVLPARLASGGLRGGRHVSRAGEPDAERRNAGGAQRGRACGHRGGRALRQRCAQRHVCCRRARFGHDADAGCVRGHSRRILAS